MSRKLAKIFIALPPLSGITSAGVVVANQFIKKDEDHQEKTNAKIEIKKDEDVNKISIFPKIHNEDFYNDIKVKNGAPFFDNDFIAKVVTYIIAKTIVADGKIAWNYRFLDISKTKLAFRFEWRIKENFYLQPQAIEYLFELSKN